MRQELVDLILTSLKQITVANGYLTDAGKDVSEWTFIDESNPETTLQVRDIACTPQEGEHVDNAEDAVNKRLELRIIYIVSEKLGQKGLATATLRKALRDIFAAVKTISFPNEVYDCSWGGDEFSGQQESRKYVGMAVTLYVDYTVDPWTD